MQHRVLPSPEVLHAGAPTPLAVTVFADFPGKVTAEVTHGNTKVAHTEAIQGGLTSVLTLPPISGSLSHNSLLNLTVKGYKGDSLIFTNTTILTFSTRNVTVFIQTDRSRYKPGDGVKIRVVSVHLDNHPYRGRVEISVQDPSGGVVEMWESTGNLGIVYQEFSLSPMSPLGEWKITTTVNGLTDEKTVTVEDHELPPFEMLVKTSYWVLVGNDIWGSVRALYSSGQPVRGSLVVNVTLEAAANDVASPFQLTQTKEIYGSAQFFFSTDQLQPLHSSSAINTTGPIVVHISACVNDSSTGLKVNKRAEVHFMQNTYQLVFIDFPPSLKPSLHFSATLRITRYDRKPLSSSDLTHPVVVKVTQRAALMNMGPTTLTLPVPEDGNIHIKFKLQNQVEMVFIQARFQSSEETLRVHTNYSSPSGSYIQISPPNTLSAQIGSPLQLNVESTFKPVKFHFVVSSKGQVVAAGTKNSSSFSLTPALSWSPEACVHVYCLLSNGEVISDTAHVSIHQHNNVTLDWSSEKAQPDEQVSLTVAAHESGFQVGIVVIGMHNDALQYDPDFKERECNLKMLTNAGLYQKKQSDGSKNGKDYLIVEKYWSHWVENSESLLWLDSSVSDNVWTSEKITVPDGVSFLGAFALVMSKNLGLSFTPVPRMLTVSKDFSLSLAVPSHLIRGEEIVLEVNIINHLEQSIEVIVLLAQSEAFEFVLTERKDVSVINAQKLTVGSHVSASALFPIRPLALGEMEISVDAVSAETSDILVRKVMVKPEGVEKSFSQTLFLELTPEMDSSSTSVSFSFPPHVVPGSQKAYMALGGDILALSINNLESLIQLPTGCGEQNMFHFAASVYVLQYLVKSTQDDSEISSKALEYIKKGYQKQLSYQRNDGSFSAFGAKDTSGSTWLTSFVLRCFIQAQPYIQVNQGVLTRAMTWLLKHQGPQGEFTEVGKLIHTEMQGELDDGPVALTAYVLLAFLENETYAGMYADNVSLALRYLESKVSSSVVSNYSLCLVAYTLALGNRPAAERVITELIRRADYRDGIMMWASSAGLRSHDWQPRSAQIEMASYVLMALFMRGNFIEGITLMKWLSTQRNHLGGFGTTQDTVVALQALAYYSAFSGANAIDLRFNISSPTSSFVFQINSTNYRLRQSQEIIADEDLLLNIYLEGRGFALFQMNVFYNVESEAADKEAFSLKANLTDDSNSNHMMLSICTRLKDNQAISQTGMAIMEVGMLSGFSLFPEAALPAGLIMMMKKAPEKIILYLDSINKSEVCIQLPIVRNYKVAHVKDAMVQVHDYYEPTRRARSTYNSDILQNIDSCFFCGENCDICRPGITITTNSFLPSRSVSGATFSLSCLCLGVTAFFVLF
ncbi:CD109 antigen-like [Melanotaenia boesemani]|uniref:CD109 antigen-like n=1 Tax=Melanotaenia boesemani TaxID=1250792 RepID=UPI001C04BFA3|nr:CD109 antigen-like [Melanotaenia boesemani]